MNTWLMRRQAKQERKYCSPTFYHDRFTNTYRAEGVIPGTYCSIDRQFWLTQKDLLSQLFRPHKLVEVPSPYNSIQDFFIEDGTK
jgi:hypothetical protein